MASLHELDGPIPQEKLESLRVALENLQGNILQSHGRDHSVHIFLHFKSGQKTGVKTWIKELAKHVTSAQQQRDDARRYRRFGLPGPMFMGFFLTASGYRYLLDLTSDKDPNFNDEAFLRGMKSARHRLNDLPPEVWDDGYREDIHAMVLLADNDEQGLLRKALELVEGVSTYAEICAVEHGRVLRNAQGESIEHFGYADGLGQPLFFQEDIDRERPERNGTTVWAPGARLDAVFVPDPYGAEKDSTGKVVHHHSGSYLVFRKLEQNVRKYKEREQGLAQALGLTGEDAKRAGALVVGRFEDGTPVVLQPTAGRPTNNFTYDEDPDGEKCPLQAHIRKLNPRKNDGYALTPLIVRRGITYGKRWKEPKDYPSLEELPSKGVGLLFMCYQRNIADQFEYLQFRLANDPGPIDESSGIDPIIGQPGGMGAGPHRWPAHWGDPREKHRPFDFYGFVTLKGGEYFFAPSLYFLKNIEEILGQT
jgi:Dyp-type peroxidase family